MELTHEAVICCPDLELKTSAEARRFVKASDLRASKDLGEVRAVLRKVTPAPAHQVNDRDGVRLQLWGIKEYNIIRKCHNY